MHPGKYRMGFSRKKTKAVTARKSYIVCEDEDRFKIGQIMLLKTAVQLLFENLSNNFLNLKTAMYKHLTKKLKRN